MIVDLTVPIYVNEEFLTEFDAAVDIRVTHRGYRTTPLAIGSPPEFVVDEYLVNTRHYKGRYPDGRWLDDYHPAPTELVKYIDQYVEGDALADIYEAIEHRAA